MRGTPGPDGLIPLTLNEIRYLFAALVINPTQAVGVSCDVRPGGDGINTRPNRVTTSANQSWNREDHDLLLE